LESSEAPNAAAEKYRASSLRKLGQFIKGASKSALIHQANKHLGEDATEILKAGMSEVSETVVRSVIEEHRNKMNVISELKTEIENWITLITTDSELSKPMFVFIDELDRCRPTYAIELLETVKHLFDVKGLVFVIATNTDQLQHSIKAVYGSEFDAQRYLYRFFNRSFTLKKADLLSFIRTQPVFKDHLSEALLSTCDGNVIVENEEVLANNLAAIAESFCFDLRTTLQWMDQLYLCFASNAQRKSFLWPVIALMIATKAVSQKIYENIFVENESWEEAIKQVHRLHEMGTSLIPHYRLRKNLSLKLKGMSLLYAVKDNSLFDFDKSRYRDIEMPIDLTLLARISAMLLEFESDASLTDRNYFTNKDARRSIEEVSETPAFLSTLKNQLIAKNKNRDSYLNLVDLASDLA
tara:strand:+ start:989 stop:2221 length:1233 start_codon:yes stop_codon:yes gene_type:complete